MVPEQTLTLEQRMIGKGCQRFQINADDTLDYTLKKFGVERGDTISLSVIDSKPVRVKLSPAGPLVGLIIFGLASLFCLCAAVRMGLSVNNGFLYLLPVAGIMFSVCLVKYLQMRVNVLYFCSRYSGNAVISLWFNRPSQKQFEAFCETLKDRIKRASPAEANPGGESSLPNQIRELKALFDTGALSTEEFETAKAKILGSPKRQIGFAKSA